MDISDYKYVYGIFFYHHVNILFIVIIIFFLYYLCLLGLPAFADVCVLGCDDPSGEQNFSETGFKLGLLGLAVRSEEEQ